MAFRKMSQEIQFPLIHQKPVLLAKWWRDIQVYCDAYLKTEDGGHFPIHRIALHNASLFFAVLFYNSKKDDSKVLHGMTKSTLKVILEYIYTGKPLINKNNICQILVASDYLLMDSLLKDCVQFVKINNSIETCVELYITALKLLHLGLEKQCYQFIQRNFETIVLQNYSFHKFPYYILLRFLQDDSLNISGEEIAWKAIVKWVGNGEENRLELVYDLLCCLKYNDLTPKYVENEILMHPIVLWNPHCQERMKKVKFDLKNDSITPSNWCEEIGLKCQTMCSRKPSSINFFVRLFFEGEDNYEGCILYEMYDNHCDYWREVGFQKHFVPDSMHVIHDNLYLLDTLRGIHYAFNVRVRTWTEIAPLEEDKYEYYVVVANDKIYSIGGVVYTPRFSPLKTVDVYDPNFNEWLPVNSMNFSHLGGAAVLDGKIYVAGEHFDTLHDMCVLSCECYSPETDTWRVIKAPKRYRGNLTIEAYKGYLYIIGGQNIRKSLCSAEKYNPENDCWTDVKNLPHTFSFPKAKVFRGDLVVYENLFNYGRQNEALYLADTDGDWKTFEDDGIHNQLCKFVFGAINSFQIIQNVRQYKLENSEWTEVQYQ